MWNKGMKVFFIFTSSLRNVGRFSSWTKEVISHLLKKEINVKVYSCLNKTVLAFKRKGILYKELSIF